MCERGRIGSFFGLKGEERMRWNFTFTIQHDVGSVFNHFLEKDSELCYRNHIARSKSIYENQNFVLNCPKDSEFSFCLTIHLFFIVLTYCYNHSKIKHSIGSIFTEESASSDAGSDADKSHESHRSLFSNAARLLERLKSSPSKSRLKKRRPWALKGLQKPLCRQLSPTKIRLNQTAGRAVIIVDQQARGLVRVPIRLHEQF